MRCYYSTSVDSEPLSYAYVVALEVVPLFDLRYAASVLAGDLAEVVSALDLVDDEFAVAALLDLLDSHRVEVYVCLMLIKAVLELDECVCVVVWQAEDVLSLVARDDFVAVLRIEVLEFLKRCTGEFADLFQVQLLVDAECIHSNRHSHRLRLDAVLLIICHRIKGSYKRRHISTCLAWQERPDRPEVSLSTCTADRLVDITCSAIV